MSFRYEESIGRMGEVRMFFRVILLALQDLGSDDLIRRLSAYTFFFGDTRESTEILGGGMPVGTNYPLILDYLGVDLTEGYPTPEEIRANIEAVASQMDDEDITRLYWVINQIDVKKEIKRVEYAQMALDQLYDEYSYDHDETTMNCVRIWVYFAVNPGSILHKACNALDISSGAIYWWLEKMQERGLLLAQEDRKYWAFLRVRKDKSGKKFVDGRTIK